MSNTTHSRSSALGAAASIVILPALSDSCEGSPAPWLPAGPAHAGISPAFFSPHRLTRCQFLIATNERFSLSQNFATHTKQSTSLFLFDTNERSHITARQSRITAHEFLIAGEKILKTALTPSVSTPNAFLIAGIYPLFAAQAASARPSALGSSAYDGVHGSRGTAPAARIAACGSPITTHQTLITGTGSQHQPERTIP